MATKPLRQHTPEDLARVFEGIAGKRFWTPQPVGAAVQVGPRAMVYVRHSELTPVATAPEEKYSQTIQSLPQLGALGALALINNLLVVGGANAAVHTALNERFIPGHLRARLSQRKLQQLPQPSRPALQVVFNRVACLLSMCHLISFGTGSQASNGAPVEAIGELALLANEFIQPGEFDPTAATNISELALQLLPVWDLYNPADLACALPRMFTIFTEILPGNDAQVRKLSARLGLDHTSLEVDGLPLVDYVSVVFGLFAHGRKVEQEGTNAVIFDCARLFEKAPRILPSAERLIAHRGLTIAEFRARLDENADPKTALLEDLRQRSFLASGLNTFRKCPLLRVDQNRTVILDLQFLVDLLTAGIYWHIFDNLSRKEREIFQQLWGRLLELYATGLLREFYPPPSGILGADLSYDGGQIDALLDFASDVVVFEIKSSLLSEAAKRKCDRAEFEKQVNIKFVRNERGKPKAVLQLARSCEAIAAGSTLTSTRPKRIYPVLVSDEPALQAFGFNTLLNAIFRQESQPHPTIRPLTVMTINEFEEILGYASNQPFSWAELLESRFANGEVSPFSVHQAIYDWRQTRGSQFYRNEILLKRFDQVFLKVKETYGFED